MQFFVTCMYVWYTNYAHKQPHHASDLSHRPLYNQPLVQCIGKNSFIGNNSGWLAWCRTGYALTLHVLCMDCSMFCQVQVLYCWKQKQSCILCISILQISTNVRMVTMEAALINVPIPLEATSVHADVAMNSRGKMEHQEVELVVWSWTKILMLEESVKVDYYFNMLFSVWLASFLFPSLVTSRNLRVLQSSMKDYQSILMHLHPYKNS